jgi:hypothetical protein
MTGADAGRPRLLTRGFWAMMVLAALSFLAAAAVVTFGSRHLGARPGPPPRAAPLAGGARGAKTAAPQSSLGPP